MREGEWDGALPPRKWKSTWVMRKYSSFFYLTAEEKTINRRRSSLHALEKKIFLIRLRVWVIAPSVVL